jgi:hypothetical protein
MGCGIEVIDESRVRPDGGADAQRSILASDEDFKVIVHEGSANAGSCRQATCVEEDRMPTEPLGLAGHCGLRAVNGSGDLSVAGTGGEPRGDRNLKHRPFEVVGRGEGLSRACVLTVEAFESWDTSWVVLGAVRPIAMKASTAGSMSEAFRPRAEQRHEARRTHGLNGPLWPAHATGVRARMRPAESEGNLAALLSARCPHRPARGHHGRSISQQACGHRGCASDATTRGPS